MNFDKPTLRATLGLFVTGVTIITCRDRDGAPVGITANSFNSVSLDPPLVLWSVGNNASSMEAFLHASHFAVHILSERQTDLANRFARSGTDKFEGLSFNEGLGRVPLLPDYAARLECTSYANHAGGDHQIFIAEVSRLVSVPEARPLVFHGGRYSELADFD